MTVSFVIPIDATERVFPAGTSLSVHPHGTQNPGAALLSGSATATAIAGDPALASPGFEDGVGSWSLLETTGTGGALAAESSTVLTGGGSAKVTAGTGDDAIGIEGPTDVADQIAASEGDVLTVSAYVRSAVGTPDATASIVWVDAEESDIDTDDGSAVALVAGQWVKVTASATAPADTATARVVIAIASPANSSVYYIDDVDYFGLESGDQTTIAGLDAETSYEAWGQVSGAWRSLGFRTPEA